MLALALTLIIFIYYFGNIGRSKEDDDLLVANPNHAGRIREDDSTSPHDTEEAEEESDRASPVEASNRLAD
jgi:hypothetical protein